MGDFPLFGEMAAILCYSLKWQQFSDFFWGIFSLSVYTRWHGAESTPVPVLAQDEPMGFLHKWLGCCLFAEVGPVTATVPDNILPGHGEKVTKWRKAGPQ